MTTNRKAGDEAEIRRIIEAWTAGLQAKDVDAVMKHAAPDILSYDLAPPLASRGAETYRKNLQAWFPTFDGPITFESRELEITVGGDVAFSTSLNRIGGSKTSGEQAYVWARVTVGFRKIDGRWMVTHEHASTPFYMDGSYKAAVDLSPDDRGGAG
jgi:ketosteroid isomerase-like protein